MDVKGEDRDGCKLTSIMLSSTNPAVRNVHGYFHETPGTITNQGISIPVTPFSGNVANTALRKYAPMDVRTKVRVRIRVAMGTV